MIRFSPRSFVLVSLVFPGLALIPQSRVEAATTSTEDEHPAADAEDPDDSGEPRPGADGIGDTYFPTLGAGGYDVQHYDLTLEVELEYDTIDARARIEAKALHALSSFNLDLHGLEVAAVEVNGKEAGFARDERELTVTPVDPIASGADFTVEVFYGGEPTPAPDASHPFRPGVGWHRRETGIYVLSECVGAASWFPCNDHPRDKATFSFTVTAPKPYVVAANGILKDERDEGDKRTYVFEASDAMAPYLATVNIAEFDVIVEEGPGGIPLRTYHPTDATDAELAPFRRQAEIVEFLELCFGPYPFESVGAIISYENMGGALETQTIPVYSRGLNEGVIAHELAHQWFGDYVSTHNWEDMWLNEGFATYAAFLWDEFDRGPAYFEARMEGLYTMLRQREVIPPVDPGVGRLFGASSYMRGAWVLHALRLEVDDELFFQILQSWVEKNAGSTATTSEFIELCEELAERELDELFQGVLFDPVIPEDPRYLN